MTNTDRLKRSQSTALPAMPRWLPIALILTLATVLFLYRIGSEGLWLDELNSVKDATQNSVGDYLDSPIRPLYYLLLMGWMRLGEGDVWLRLLSVIFAVISVFLLYHIGRRLAGEHEGRIAALLLALSPVVVNHAQEIRMYPLSLCLGLAGTLFLVDTLLVEPSEQPSQKSMAGWMLFRLLAIYTIPLNLMLLLPDTLIVLARFRRQRAVLVSYAKWLFLLFLLWLPAIFFVLQASSPNSEYANDHIGAKPPGASEIFRLLKFLTVWPFAVQKSAIAALFYKSFTVLVAGLVGAGLIRKHRSPTLLWTGMWFFLPALPILGFSYLLIPIWKTRYLLFVSPYLFILLAAGFTRLWRQWRIAAVVIGSIYFVAVSGGLFHHYTVQERPDYKFNIATIEQYEQVGDGLVWSYECCETGLRWYYQGSMASSLNSVKDVDTPQEISQWVSEFPSGHDRLWLVLDGFVKDRAAFKQAIAKVYKIEKTFDYEQGSQVMLLTPLPENKAQGLAEGSV